MILPHLTLIINGSICEFFKGRKGLRQGDPLSHLLFVCCMEYLSRALTSVTENSDYNFHPKCGSLRITHLALADDVMMLARGDVLSVKIIMDCLRDFGVKSGLHANALKSSIFTAGLRGQELQEILQVANFSLGAMPFRYLGIPLAAVKLCINHYEPLINRITDCIKSWNVASLSYAGRVELIRAVLQGIGSFWLAILPIPAVVIDKIIRICRQFVWNSKSPLVAWKFICLPMAEGGLGLKDLKCWNMGFFLKVLWNFHTKKDSLWVRWVHHYYFSKASVWESQSSRDDSPLLKMIFGIRDKLIHDQGSP